MDALTAIAARAKLADADAPAASTAPAGQASPAAPVLDHLRVRLAGEIAGLLSMSARIVKPLLPNVAAIYSDETCKAVGEAVAPVCVKHGWLQGGLFEKWGEEIGAAVVVLPLSFATAQAAMVDVAVLKAKQRGQGPSSKASSGAGTAAAAGERSPSSQAQGTAAPDAWIAAAKKDEGSQ